AMPPLPGGESDKKPTTDKKTAPMPAAPQPKAVLPKKPGTK
ncbi:MAG TPA: cell envelope biogenesis protein TolA, partial [Chitinophagaceae bacterium]|nr:cell envelope biogenesis protein TolA [Chitinophagaceae bacterium]